MNVSNTVGVLTRGSKSKHLEADICQENTSYTVNNQTLWPQGGNLGVSNHKRQVGRGAAGAAGARERSRRRSFAVVLLFPAFSCGRETHVVFLSHAPRGSNKQAGKQIIASQHLEWMARQNSPPDQVMHPWMKVLSLSRIS